MTKEQFEKSYTKRSGMTKEFYREHFVSLPCKCTSETCMGWAAIHNDKLSIKTHKKLYS